MESIKTTRIADLPDSYSSIPQPSSRQDDAHMAPLHVHPNPYGIPSQVNANMPMPIAQPPSQNQSQSYPPPVSLGSSPQDMSHRQSSMGLTPEQMAMMQQMPSQHLPSRDIPVDTTQYSQDSAIQPNYIPKPRRTDDYIQEYETRTEKKMREYEIEKEIDASNDHLFDRFQRPIMLAILFFMYTLPIVNTLVFKRLSFLSIYNDDGYMNIYGNILKSILFASTFWSIENSLRYLSEI